ncbi:replication initiation protein [Yunchengibacter salinarum]|uniref:replication initiation protein n=1 Tax=Yunchengibacter salinarum TaxID=3133399 RepID=UPI0035B622E3
MYVKNVCMSRKQKTKTTDVIRAAEGRETIVAGELVTVDFPKGGSPSLLASKLFVQLLDQAGADVVKDKAHRVLLADLNWSHRDLDYLAEAVRELQRTVIEITVQTANGPRRKSGQFLTDVERDLDAATGELMFHFSKTVRQVVRNSTHWAAVSARAVLAFECKYSIWLYQLAALHAHRDQAGPTFPLDELRQQMGASAKSLRIWQNFRNRVLEPAIAEINQLTGITVDYQPVKRGRKIEAVRLFCRKKDQDELRAAAAEQARPKTGRKARRADLVEQVAAERRAQQQWVDAKLAEAEAKWQHRQLDLDDAFDDGHNTDAAFDWQHAQRPNIAE